MAAPRTVRAGLHDAVPIAFSENGQPRGFLVDVLNHIAAREDWQIEYVHGTWQQGLDRLEAGEIDLVFPILKTDGRQARFDFNTVPAFATWGEVFAAPAARVESIVDLARRRVGGIAGDRFAARLDELIRTLDIKPQSFRLFETNEGMFNAARAGTIDAFAMESLAGHVSLNEHGFRATPIAFQPSAPLFATTHGRNADLLAALDRHLRALKDDPASLYYKAHEAWFAPPPTVPGWVLPGGLGAAALLVLLGGFSLLLRRQVARKTAELLRQNQALADQIAARERIESERADLARQLERAERLEAMGAVSAGMAHDFNNLLMVISANLESLPALRSDTNGAGAAVFDAIQQARGLTRSLLTFGQRNPSEKQPLELATLVAGAERMLRRMLPATIQLEVHLDRAERAWIYGDPVGMQQVLMNLSLNARDAMPAGGTLNLRLTGPAADAEDPKVTLEVTDTGHGMTPEQRLRAFEPFYTTKPRTKGTGLGLAIVHGVVADHGGRIELHSQPGQGTRFRITLPGVPPADATVAVPPPPEEAALILLAESQRATREVLATFLTGLGHRVEQFSDGDAVLQAFLRKRESVGLLVLDVDLPGRRGVEVLDAVRSAQGGVGVVMISGSPQGPPTGDDPRTRVLVKPFALPELGRLAHDLLRKETA